MHTLEAPVRLSQSLLWEIQRRFYDRLGPEAWEVGGVPMHLLSNPVIARACAEVVFGVLVDLRRTLERPATVQIIDLGAGTGRFAYLLVKELIDLQENALFPSCRFRVILTDFTRSNLEAWSHHPQFQDWIAAGLVDFALFDADAPGDLVLHHSGDVISPGSLDVPPIGIANYFFDSIAQDAFHVGDGVLYDCRVGLKSTRTIEEIHQSSMPLDHLAMLEQRVPVEAPYDDPALNEIILGYKRHLKDTSFLFPVGAIRCIQWLSSLGSGQAVLLCNDKGYVDLGHILQSQGIPLVPHRGVFSLLLNYDAIAKTLQRLGGQAVFGPHQEITLVTCLGAIGAQPWDLPMAHHTFRQHFTGFTPLDHAMFLAMIDEEKSSFLPQHILSLLRLHRCDPEWLRKLHGGLLDSLEQLKGHEREELVRILEAVWANYFHVQGRIEDIAVVIGMLMQALGRPADAIAYYDRSIALYGINEMILYNQTLCHMDLHQWEIARERVETLLEHNSTHREARRALQRLMLKMNR